MIQLPFGNHCSTISISPKDWEEETADAKKEWFIFYRFYTPEKPKGKLVIVKTGLNTFKSLKDKRSSARQLVKDVKEELDNGYNPILGDYVEIVENSFEISPETSFCKALGMAFKRLKIEDTTRNDIRNILGHVEKAARLIGYDKIKIEEIRKKHIKIILDKVGESKGDKWTANNFNHFRKYLSIVFKELVELDAIEFNPIAGIAKQKTVKKIKKLLTLEERKLINEFLHAKHYRFWVFTHIFFHSGGRRTEFMKIQGKHVDLENQTVLVTVIKGKTRREVLKVIKDVALPFWIIAMEGCGKDNYVFSKGLKPGLKMINPKQVTRRWRTHIKGVKGQDGTLVGGLGITAGFYDLKYLHSDQVAELLSLDEARKHNSHTNTNTTRLYAVNEDERKANRIKKLANEF